MCWYHLRCVISFFQSKQIRLWKKSERTGNKISWPVFVALMDVRSGVGRERPSVHHSGKKWRHKTHSVSVKSLTFQRPQNRHLVHAAVLVFKYLVCYVQYFEPDLESGPGLFAKLWFLFFFLDHLNMKRTLSTFKCQWILLVCLI